MRWVSASAAEPPSAPAAGERERRDSSLTLLRAQLEALHIGGQGSGVGDLEALHIGGLGEEEAAEAGNGAAGGDVVVPSYAHALSSARPRPRPRPAAAPGSAASAASVLPVFPLGSSSSSSSTDSGMAGRWAHMLAADAAWREGVEGIMEATMSRHLVAPPPPAPRPAAPSYTSSSFPSSPWARNGGRPAGGHPVPR
jgi:hypothetical protein